MKKSCRLIASALGILVLCLSLHCNTVEAGFSHETIDSSSFAEELNSAVWSNPESDVTAKDGKLVFSKDSTKYTRLVSKNMVQQTEGYDEFTNASFELQLKSMPKKGEFKFGFGLGSIESFSGEAGQVEIVFINNGGLQMEVRSYKEADKEKKIVKAKSAGFSVGSTADVDVSIKNNKTMTVKVNGRTVASEKLPFLPEGSVGFFQTGECAVEIGELRIVSYKYDRPENVDFTETFDEDRYNVNTLFSKAISSGIVPSTMSVEEYDGDYVMFYENTGYAQIGSMYQYSNFEITFDVPYVLRKAVEDEEGNVVQDKSMWMGVSFGDEMLESTDDGFTYSPEMIYFDRDSTVKSYAQGNIIVGQSDKYPFFAEDETRGFSVKVSVVDAHVTIGMKWIEEDKFTTIGEFDTVDGKTPLGYVHIWTCGPANFAIDNIKLKNLDENPNLIEVDYKSSKFDVPEDYVYQPDELVFRQVEEEDDTFNWYLIIPCAAALGVLIVGASAVTVAIKKKRQGKGE